MELYSHASYVTNPGQEVGRIRYSDQQSRLEPITLQFTLVSRNLRLARLGFVQTNLGSAAAGAVSVQLSPSANADAPAMQ